MAYVFTPEEELILDQLAIHEDMRPWLSSLDVKYKFGQEEIRGIEAIFRSLAEQDLEPSLGSPGTDGLVLKSFADGTRYWESALPSTFFASNGYVLTLMDTELFGLQPEWQPVPPTISGLTAGVIPLALSDTAIGDSFIATSGANGGTFTVRDTTPVTGDTQFIVQESATQTSGAFYVKSSSGINLLFVHPHWSLGYTAVQQLRFAGNADGGFALNTLGLSFAVDSNEVGLRFRASSYATADVEFLRVAAGVMEQRAGAQRQEWRIYDTYTDASNYNRLAIRVNTSYNSWDIIQEIAGTGVGRHFQLASPGGMYINLGGDWNLLAGPYGMTWTGGWSPKLIVADNIPDLGGKTNRWKDFYTAGRSYLGAANTAPADADLVNGTISFYLDEGTNDLKVRVRYSDGTLKTATVALA